MDLKFDTLKFKKTIDYGSPEEELLYFNNLKLIDPVASQKKTEDIYRELIHIKLSYNILFKLLAIFMLIPTIFIMYNSNENTFPIIFLIISVTLFLIGGYFKYLAENIYRSFIFCNEVYKHIKKEKKDE